MCDLLACEQTVAFIDCLFGSICFSAQVQILCVYKLCSFCYFVYEMFGCGGVKRPCHHMAMRIRMKPDKCLWRFRLSVTAEEQVVHDMCCEPTRFTFGTGVSTTCQIG